jgi:hypothetical protein
VAAAVVFRNVRREMGMSFRHGDIAPWLQRRI